jgi:putative PIN family toxin of toxin-antitoxin system
MKAESSAGAPILRAVIDTNVWISAALSRAGAPARVVQQVLAHGRPVFSPATFAELEKRLWLPKFDRYLSLELRRRILHDIDAAAHWVDAPVEIAARLYCRDADDDKFIHAALAAGAPWLLTGDRDLLDLAPVPDLRILSPAEALQLPAFSA